MKIGIATIHRIVSDDKIRDFSTFLYLRSLFKKGCFYNYTQLSLSKESGISRTAIAKYIAKFKSYGWVRLHEDNLIFNGNKHFREDGFNKHVQISALNVKDIIQELKYIIIKHKLIQYETCKKAAHAIIMADTNPQVTIWAIRFQKKQKFNANKLFNQNEALKISHVKLAKMFNCSKATVNRTMKRMQKDGKIKISTFERKVLAVTKNKYNIEELLQTKNRYYANGRVRSVVCNAYKLVA